MSSVSISSLILFIAAMLIAAGVAGTLVTNVHDISSSIDGHSSDLREQIETDVAIISDPGSGVISEDGNTTILVKNTGERTLSPDPSQFDVLLNGEYVGTDAINVSIVSGDTWRTGDVAVLTIDEEQATGAELSAGEHRIVIIVNSDREVFEFYTDD